MSFTGDAKGHDSSYSFFAKYYSNNQNFYINNSLPENEIESTTYGFGFGMSKSGINASVTISQTIKDIKISSDGGSYGNEGTWWDCNFLNQPVQIGIPDYQKKRVYFKSYLKLSVPKNTLKFTLIADTRYNVIDFDLVSLLHIATHFQNYLVITPDKVTITQAAFVDGGSVF